VDVLALILRVVREHIEATGVQPDALQNALYDAEHSLRRSVGGAVHHISRVQYVPTKARILELSESGLTNRQIAERLGVSDRWVRKVVYELRSAGA
jgi:DNA-binding NarL/FixJ family response regulator